MKVVDLDTFIFPIKVIANILNCPVKLVPVLRENNSVHRYEYIVDLFRVSKVFQTCLLNCQIPRHWSSAVLQLSFSRNVESALMNNASN